MTEFPRKEFRENRSLKTFTELLLYGPLCHLATEWRIIPLISRSIREYESKTFLATFHEFYQWITEPSAVVTGHSFYKLPKYDDKSIAVYADYKYFREIFEEFLSINSEENPQENSLVISGSKLYYCSQTSAELRLILDWKDYDQETLGAEFATFWIGSCGAHTPLHYDSYGRNVVIQVYGEKEWLLWSPSDENMQVLSPCRIPYEESSIYADGNQYDPQVQLHYENHPPNHSELLLDSHILYLPKHWWHYVSTKSDISISMNMWIPQDSSAHIGHSDESLAPNDDKWDQFTEAICRFLYGSVMDAFQRSNQGIPLGECEGWYSPSEKSDSNNEDAPIPPDLIDHDQNLEYLFITLANLCSIHPTDISSDTKKRILQVLLASMLHPNRLEETATTIIESVNRMKMNRLL